MVHCYQKYQNKDIKKNNKKNVFYYPQKIFNTNHNATT